MTGQSNLMQENITSKNNLFSESSDVVFRHKKRTRCNKGEQIDHGRDAAIPKSGIFFGDISKHRQATIYEIDVEIRLDNCSSFSLRPGSNNNKSSKMKSTTLSKSTMTSSYPIVTDQSESENDKQHSKYSSQAIARILHTKQRIRRLLDVPPDGPPELNYSNGENAQNPKASNEKSPRLSKFANNYLTLTSKPKYKIPSFYSLPNSSGRSKDSFSPRNALTLKRAKSDVTQQTKHLSYSRDSTWLNVNLDKLIGAKHEGKQNSNNGFLYSNDSHVHNHKKNLSQNRHKSLIPTSPFHANEININNNHENALSLTQLKDHGSNLVLVDQEDDSTKHKFLSLKRRFSRKSQSRRRSFTRHSIAADELLSTKYSEAEDPFYSPYSRKLISPFSPLKYEKTDDEVNAPKNDDLSDTQTHKKSSIHEPKHRRSIKERFVDFVAKRSPSLKRKSVSRKEEDSPGRTMNKNLSSSSPQLSIYAVNKYSASARGFE